MSRNKKIQPIVDEITKKQAPPKSQKKDTTNPPQDPPKPAELDQDPGAGYNPDHTYPQT